jgi:hypothetical protein
MLLIRVLAAARAPESAERSEFVVVRLELSVEKEPEREIRLVLVFPSDFERILIFVSSVVRRSNIVLKILEKAPCILERRGAELNSVLD